MNNRRFGNVLAGVALICFLVAIIGMAMGGSHRWVEPVEELGWMFFTGCVLVLYLMADKDPDNPMDPRWVQAAWGFGILAIVLLFAAFIANIASAAYHYWFEALETAGLVCMVLTIISAVMAGGPLGLKKKDRPRASSSSRPARRRRP
jgi:peptidoglycan/LPS O-acetylase OafA/YrhL